MTFLTRKLHLDDVAVELLPDRLTSEITQTKLRLDEDELAVKATRLQQCKSRCLKTAKV